MTYYAKQRLSTANSLTHHGVKGMKWGVRKRFTDSVNALSNRYKSRYTDYDAYKKEVKTGKKNVNKIVKKTAKTTAKVVGLGTLGTYGISRALGQDHSSAARNARGFATGAMAGGVITAGNLAVAAPLAKHKLKKQAKRKYMKKYQK